MVTLRTEQIPEGYTILSCEICKSQIGLFRPKDLTLPLDSTMFKSIDEHHKIPPPFPCIPGRGSTMTWEAAMCPTCGRRPFLTRDHVMTPHGRYKVGSDEIPHKETQAERNQREIDRIAAEEQAKEAPKPTIEQKNQEIINHIFSKMAEDMPVKTMPVSPANEPNKRGRKKGWKKQDLIKKPLFTG